ncbi:hypothetical protein C6988_09765 [Nitrosopumilus sp. b1]|uniref:response regulator n=1 Tax=Nitrosopumilus sp. b1 TaxID=2109907 RepID=UPI0015F39941|nr:response regulator [Nitrosopumilus sp. b1]KAF6242193.1 hypothetical protein C6988_09765 [Nitrosopumilus sp. b1]
MVVLRRNKIELFYDILSTIHSEQRGLIKPTHLQLRTKMSYDKLINNLHELEKDKFIQLDPILITEKGEKFIQDYGDIKKFMTDIKRKYLKEKIIFTKQYDQKIMVVDDDEDLLNMLSNIIKNFGYPTILARNGQEAVLEYSIHKPRLVLMDINMPVKDGYKSFFDITKKFPDARVIFMTGFKDLSRWKEVKNKGAIYLVQKPIAPTFLKELITRHANDNSESI